MVKKISPKYLYKANLDSKKLLLFQQQKIISYNTFLLFLRFFLTYKQDKKPFNSNKHNNEKKSEIISYYNEIITK